MFVGTCISRCAVAAAREGEAPAERSSFSHRWLRGSVALPLRRFGAAAIAVDAAGEASIGQDGLV